MLAHSGVLNIALAASCHRVPFVVLTGLYKLCPLFAFDQDTFNEANPPSHILQFQDEGTHTPLLPIVAACLLCAVCCACCMYLVAAMCVWMLLCLLHVSGCFSLLPLIFYSRSWLFDWFVSAFVDKVEIQNPAYDYVTPQLINLFVSNL